MNSENIYPIEELLLQREVKESALGQKASAFWFCGLSGSGKSTLAVQLEKDLHQKGLHSVVLDGDNLRKSLSKDLGFSEDDREENHRRASEVAKILINNGVIAIISFISPMKRFRENAREIIGDQDFQEIYIKASVQKCESRDVKGLYAKEKLGDIRNLTGKHASFEEPLNPWLTINSEIETQAESAKKLFDAVYNKVKI